MPNPLNQMSETDMLVTIQQAMDEEYKNLDAQQKDELQADCFATICRNPIFAMMPRSLIADALMKGALVFKLTLDNENPSTKVDALKAEIAATINFLIAQLAEYEKAKQLDPIWDAPDSGVKN